MEGKPADLVVFDPEETYLVEHFYPNPRILPLSGRSFREWFMPLSAQADSYITENKQERRYPL